MKKRIFFSICAVALGCLLLFGACVVVLVYAEATRSGFENLRISNIYLAAGYEAEGEAYLKALSQSPERITLIAPDGTVLYDNQEDAAAMPNHAGRPEVVDALKNGSGQAERQSETFGGRQLYYALRLPDGNVLRVSMRVGTVAGETLRFIPWLVLIVLLLVLLAALAARSFAKRLIQPINRLDLDAPLETKAYDELAPLLRRIAAQQQYIRTQMARLRAQQEEFEVITSHMHEGLVVLNAGAQVLSMNQSARRILGVTAPLDEQPPLLQLTRNIPLAENVKQALAGHSAEMLFEAEGRTYRTLFSPTAAEGAVGGAVLLFVDDTEKLQAEQRRRQFTANVSHELKTPLTSISGYAEIIQNGLAQPEDVAGFAGRIHGEAARLIALIEDIIQLSQLDERDVQLQREELELLELARLVAGQLGPAAAAKNTALQVKGNPVHARLVRSVVVEVLYNLLDNAIRYSPPGSHICVQVGHSAAGATLSVQDDGPGIPPQHQDRVFERFYRIDKSHSRSGGGTGLGLSIVKNGVLYHGGTVTLHSTPGAGSRFDVIFPTP